MGILIGKRGQTLDSLQYLTSLVVNKEQNEYIRVKLDTENYRKRRKDTLENLAKNIAFKVKKTRKPVALEPMNPYERRIIHAVVSEIPGIYSKSKGEDPNRRVIIISENPKPSHYGNKRGGNGKGGRGQQSGGGGYRGQRSGGYTRTRSNKPTIEQMLKEDKDYVNRTKQKNDDQLDAKLYSKIELD